MPVTCAFTFNQPYVFEVSSLLPGTSYMVKASYSAATPARFSFEFSVAAAEARVDMLGPSSPGLRRILNTAIAHFESATSPTPVG